MNYIDDKIIANANALNMKYVAEYYGFEIKHGFISCPFHGEKSASLRLYEKTFYCFGCGINGSAINFVMKYFGLDFIKAVEKLKQDFYIN